MATERRFKSRTARMTLFAAASLVALILLGAAMEIVLRVIGYGRPTERVDLFYGFDGTNPVFVEQGASNGEREYAPAPNKPEFEQRFQVSKPPGTYRIFTFGGSTTRGVPWNHRGSFSWWLEHYLQQAYPEIKIEVINLGLSGAGTTRELRNLKEAVGYQPDLFVVYTSQNEFLDAEFHAAELKRPRFVSNIMKVLLSSRAVYFTYYRFLVLKARFSEPRVTSRGAKMIAKILSKPFSPRSFQPYDYYRVPEIMTSGTRSPITPSEDPSGGAPAGWAKGIVKRMLGEAGVETVKNLLGRSEISDEEIFDNFGRNVREMIEISKRNRINILFLSKARNPKSMNLLDGYAVRDKSIKPVALEEWRSHYREGIRRIKRGECREAIESFNGVRSAALPEYRNSDSLLNLYTGECYEKTGRHAEARGLYEMRLDRGHVRINQIMRETAASLDVPVIDVQQLLADHTPNGIVGYNVFLDGVHMRRGAYQRIGFTLSQFIASRGYLPPGGREPESPEPFLPSPLDEGDVPGEFRTAKVFTHLGWSEFDQGKFENAIGLGRQAVALDPLEFRAHQLLGYSTSMLRRYDEAEREWDALKHIWTDMLENRNTKTRF